MHNDHEGGQESSKIFFRLSPYHDQINKQVVYVGVHARRGDRLQVCSDSNLDFPVIAKIQRWENNLISNQFEILKLSGLEIGARPTAGFDDRTLRRQVSIQGGDLLGDYLISLTCIFFHSLAITFSLPSPSLMVVHLSLVKVFQLRHEPTPVWV